MCLSTPLSGDRDSGNVVYEGIYRNSVDSPDNPYIGRWNSAGGIWNMAIRREGLHGQVTWPSTPAAHQPNLS